MHGGQAVAQARDAIRLGQPFKVYAHDMPEFRIEVAKRFAAYNAQVGAPHDAPVPAQVRAAIRTQLGRETFRATFGRDPVDARELAGLIATARAIMPVRSAATDSAAHARR